jgi:hypothetical protein
MHDPKVPMYHRTEIAKFLMNNNHEPRPVDINMKVIVEGLGSSLSAPDASMSVSHDRLDHRPVPKLPLLN